MSSCPCGSKKKYEDCCEPFHKGKKNPLTAEQLIRARYCAFVKHEVRYVTGTTHPSALETYDEKETEKWAKGSEWLGLEIKNVEGGSADDEEGKVEFLARYKIDGQLHEHHEISELKKNAGKWNFVDGKTIQHPFVRNENKVGRNDPCPCGSGKKFKKCCGT
jgi:SEC-C motif-containing protein